MKIGSVQNVLICKPVFSSDEASELDRQVCPPSASQYFHVQSQQAYVLEPSSADYLDGLSAPFDYTAAAGFFALAFTVVVGTWMVSAGAGAVLNMIRRG